MSSIKERQLRRKLMFHKEPMNEILQKFKKDELEFKKKEEEKNKLIECNKLIEYDKKIKEEELKEDEIVEKFEMKNKIKIYVLHYKKLIERKEHIKKELNKHCLSYEFYEKYDKEELTKEELQLFDNRLKDSEKSLLYKHINVYKDIIEKNHNCALLFEDDVILDNNFNEKLSKYINQLPDNWDMLFIGNGCNLHIPKKELKDNVYIYKKETKNGSTRCTDSYLIRKKCAEKIIKIVNSNNFFVKKPADWWLNEILHKINAHVYWCEPTIVSQGTQTKLFESSIKPPNIIKK